MGEGVGPVEDGLDEAGVRVAPRVQVSHDLTDIERCSPMLDPGAAIVGIDQHPRRPDLPSGQPDAAQG